MKGNILLLFCISISSFLFGQSNNKKLLTVNGKITDEGGAPVNAASIRVLKKTNGTMSSSQGTFTLKNVVDGDSLEFTHVAYQRMKVIVKGNNLLNIEMKRDTYSLWNFEFTDTALKAITSVPKDKYDLIFTKVEIMPSFSKGKDSLYRYFKKTIKYSEEAKKKNIAGEIIIGFIVGKDGEIKNAKIVKGIFSECDEAALAAVSNMPNWLPAIQNGRTVEVYVEFSFSFSLFFTRDS